MATSGAGKGGVYDQSAAALQQSGNMYASPGLTGGASTYNPANANAATMQGSSYDPAMVANPDRIAAGIQNYMNPYTGSVIDNALSDINRMNLVQQGNIGAQATNAGAFGGSRHGLVEAMTNAEAQRNMGNLSAELRNQAFGQAAGLSAQDIANMMQTGMFNANAQNTAGQLNSQFAQQAAAANQAAQNQMALANQASQNAAGQFNANQQQNWALAQNQDQLARAGALSQLGQVGYGIGQDITASQQQQGSLQQQLIQAIMGGAMGQFDQFMNHPRNLLELQTAAVGANPLSGTGTQTSSYTPGLFDYLGLGVQSLGAWRGAS